tara:strand:- start:481 stop:1056 length:576 start_codon:yes stop_codon:yes gene_type:complete
MEIEDYESKLDQLQLEIEDTEVIETIKKVKKPRKPMTAEHKAKCMASLEKARAASRLKRGKKAKAKKIIKEQEDHEVDNILDMHLKSKAEKEEAKDREITMLKKKLDSLTLQDIIPKPPKKKIVEPEPEPEPEPERVNSVADHEHIPPPPPPMRTSQAQIKVEPLPSKIVMSNSMQSIRRQVVRPKIKPRR